MRFPICQPCCEQQNHHTIIMDKYACHDRPENVARRQTAQATSYISKDEWDFIHNLGGEMFKNYLLMEHLKTTSTCTAKLSRWLLQKEDFETPLNVGYPQKDVLDKVPSVPLTRNFDFLEQFGWQQRPFALSDRFWQGLGSSPGGALLTSAATGAGLGADMKLVYKNCLIPEECSQLCGAFGQVRGAFEPNKNFELVGDALRLKMFPETEPGKAFERAGEHGIFGGHFEHMAGWRSGDILNKFGLAGPPQNPVDLFSNFHGFPGINRAAGDFAQQGGAFPARIADGFGTVTGEDWPKANKMENAGALHVGVGLGLKDAPRALNGLGVTQLFSPGGAADPRFYRDAGKVNNLGTAGGFGPYQTPRVVDPRQAHTKGPAANAFLPNVINEAGRGSGNEHKRQQTSVNSNERRDSKQERLNALMQKLDSFYSSINENGIIQPEIQVEVDDSSLLAGNKELNLTEIVKFLKTQKAVKLYPVVYHEPFDKEKPWTFMRQFPTKIPKKYLNRISAHSLAALQAWQRLQTLLIEKRLSEQDSKMKINSSDSLLETEHKKKRRSKTRSSKNVNKKL